MRATRGRRGFYARSFRRDPEFYAYYRSLDAYRETFNNKGDLLILEPDSDFFKYMQNTEWREEIRGALAFADRSGVAVRC